MKTRNEAKTVLTCVILAIAAIALTTAAASADVVYQDNYDGDGIEVNTGIGGGAVSMNTSPASIDWAEGWWVDDGNLTMGGSGSWGGISGGSYSTNGFHMPGGFKLEVTYNALNANDRFTMGLMETAGTEQRAATGTQSWEIGYLATSGSSPFKGIYFNAFAYDSRGRYPNAPGLQLADGTSMVQLSDEQTRETGVHTLVLEMDAESNWSYSVDGAEPTTGTIGGDGFDLSKNYHFITRNQPRRASQIVDVTLTSISSFDPTDFNQDGNSDLVDLDALTAAADLATGLPVALSDPKFDLSGNDMIDSADLDIWLTDAAAINGFGSPYLKGDANLDGDCDVFAIDGSGDAQILSSNLGTTAGAVWSQGDFNGDGDVDVFAIDGSGDAQLLSSNLGSSNDIAFSYTPVGGATAVPTTMVVPEPSTIAMLMVFGLVGALCRRRR